MVLRVVGEELVPVFEEKGRFDKLSWVAGREFLGSPEGGWWEIL